MGGQPASSITGCASAAAAAIAAAALPPFPPAGGRALARAAGIRAPLCVQILQKAQEAALLKEQELQRVHVPLLQVLQVLPPPPPLSLSAWGRVVGGSCSDAEALGASSTRC